jgi:hypothetical protein
LRPSSSLYDPGAATYAAVPARRTLDIVDTEYATFVSGESNGGADATTAPVFDFRSMVMWPYCQMLGESFVKTNCADAKTRDGVVTLIGVEATSVYGHPLDCVEPAAVTVLPKLGPRSPVSPLTP